MHPLKLQTPSYTTYILLFCTPFETLQLITHASLLMNPQSFITISQLKYENQRHFRVMCHSAFIVKMAFRNNVIRQKAKRAHAQFVIVRAVGVVWCYRNDCLHCVVLFVHTIPMKHAHSR